MLVIKNVFEVTSRIWEARIYEFGLRGMYVAVQIYQFFPLQCPLYKLGPQDPNLSTWVSHLSLATSKVLVTGCHINKEKQNLSRQYETPTFKNNTIFNTYNLDWIRFWFKIIR